MSTDGHRPFRRFLSKVPEVTIVGLIVYLSMSRRDRPSLDNATRRAGSAW